VELSPSVRQPSLISRALSWLRGPALSFARQHLLSAGIVLLVAVGVQIVIQLQSPHVLTFSDSDEYLAVARRLLAGDLTLDVTRTPGYPAFLALIFALAGGQRLDIVVLAQGLLIILAALEIYLLVYRLCGRRWEAALLAALIGGNLYIANWARVILSETLTYWLLVTILLCFERYLRRPRALTLAVMTAIWVAAIFTRPQLLYLPVILLAVLAIRTARQRQLRARWSSFALALVLTYGIVFAYMGAFAATYGPFGLSKVSNIDLLGTAMVLHSRYGMPLDGAESRFDQMRSDVVAFRDGYPDPWGFIAAHPEYDTNAGAPYGTFATQVLRAHPTYVVRGVYDTFLTTTSWDQTPASLAAFSAIPSWLTPLLRLSTLISLVYACLPLLFVATAVAAWRRPDDAGMVALFALMLLVVTHIVVGALADFESFDRLRVPVDWAMLLVTGLIVTALLTGQSELRSPHADTSPQEEAS
jgi:hypothetical protein